MKKKSGLGRGLSALLSDANERGEADMEIGRIEQVDVDSIVPNPFQPRHIFDEDALQELAESIRIQGIIQPVTLRSLGGNSYQLIAGERRWQASKRIGLKQVPAFVRHADERQMLEIALIENIQREDLNPMEIAGSYQRLMTECLMKQEELSERVGKKRSTVTNYLRLLRLPPEVQKSLERNQISMGHAKAVSGLEHADQQLFANEEIIRKGLSVRATEELVKNMQTAPRPAKKTKPQILSADFLSIQKQLVGHLGTKVGIKQKTKTSGEISIPYYNLDDLNRVLELLLD